MQTDDDLTVNFLGWEEICYDGAMLLVMETESNCLVENGTLTVISEFSEISFCPVVFKLFFWK